MALMSYHEFIWIYGYSRVKTSKEGQRATTPVYLFPHVACGTMVMSRVGGP